GVDPAAAGGGPVVPQRRVPAHRLAVGVRAVDLAQDGVRARLAALVDGVVPGQVLQRAVARIGRAREAFLDAPSELVVEPQVAAAVAGRLDGLVVPLQQPLGVGEGAVLLAVGGGGQEDNLGADVP